MAKTLARRHRIRRIRRKQTKSRRKTPKSKRRVRKRRRRTRKNKRGGSGKNPFGPKANKGSVLPPGEVPPYFLRRQLNNKNAAASRIQKMARDINASNPKKDSQSTSF